MKASGNVEPPYGRPRIETRHDGASAQILVRDQAARFSLSGPNVAPRSCTIASGRAHGWSSPPASSWQSRRWFRPSERAVYNLIRAECILAVGIAAELSLFRGRLWLLPDVRSLKRSVVDERIVGRVGHQKQHGQEASGDHGAAVCRLGTFVRVSNQVAEILLPLMK